MDLELHPLNILIAAKLQQMPGEESIKQVFCREWLKSFRLWVAISSELSKTLIKPHLLISVFSWYCRDDTVYQHTTLYHGNSLFYGYPPQGRRYVHS